MIWIAYLKTTGEAKFETPRDPGRRLDPSLALYVVPAELEETWKRTHRWDPASRSLVPMPPKVKSQEQLDAERILASGIQSDADRDRLLLLLARQQIRPDLFT